MAGSGLRLPPRIRLSMSPHALLFAAWALLAAETVEAQPASVPAPPQLGQVSKDSVWVPTPERMIRRMLELADVTLDDLVVDLGAGDGRIPVYAARHFGAREISERRTGQ